MSRLWNPHHVYDNLALWLDGNDPNGNNSHSRPVEGIPFEDWKDKSKRNVKFTAYPFPAYNNPQHVLNQAVEMSVSGGAGYGAGNGGVHLDIELEPVSPSTGSDKIFVNYRVVNGAVTEVLSISGNYGYKVGDTLVEKVDQNSGNTNCIFTVTKVREMGGVVSAGVESSGLDSLESEVLTDTFTEIDVYFAAAIRTRNYNNISFIGLDDISGTNDIHFSQDGAGDHTVSAGVRYKTTGGQDSSFFTNTDENVPHIYHVRLKAGPVNESGNLRALDGAYSTGMNNTAEAAFPQGNYRWTIFQNVNTNPYVSLKSAGTLHELLVFDKVLDGENRARCLAYLSQKYKIPLDPVNPYYEQTAYAISLFNGAHKLSPRRPVQVVKMYLDFCDNVYGVTGTGSNRGLSICTANGATGSECYNTRHTCQDLTNYRVDTNGKQVYTFTSEVGNTLTGQLPNTHPALVSINSAPVEIVPTKGVSLRGNISIKLRDFISTGSDVDLYSATRDIIALENGTFFQKLIQRNPHYINRPIEIYDGYIDFEGNLQIYDGKKEYIIDGMQLDNDMLSIKCKDPMTLADELKAKVPMPSSFSLGQTLNTSTHNHINLKFDDVALVGSVAADKAKVVAEFGADNATGFVRINDEILAYRVDVSGNEAALDITGRNEWGTKGNTEAYDAGDTVQKCVFFGQYDGGGTAVTINDAAYDLLVNQAGVPAAAINNQSGGEYSWVDEKTNWLSVYRIDAIFSEPKEVNKQLSQLASMVGVNFFYDDITSQIVMRAETPELDSSVIPTITDDTIIEDSLKFINSEKDRVSRVYYYYNMRNHTDDRDKPKSFKNLYVAIDSDGELPIEYGKESNKTIYAYGVTDTSTATSVSQRILSRFKNTPKTITFKVDASQQELYTGDHFFLLTKHIVDFNGIPTTTEMQVLSNKFDSSKQCYVIKSKQFRFATLNVAGIAADNVAAFSTGGGAGTENDPYTGVRASNTYLSDANHITVSIVDGGQNFGDGETITFTPAGAGRNLAVTYSQTGGEITSITAVTSNTAALAYPDSDHDGYTGTEIVQGTGSGTGIGLQLRITKRPRMSGGQETYTVA